MSSMTAIAEAFFDACETGQGWEACRAYCTPGATFAAQAEPLLGVKTLEQYTEWMKGMLTLLPDGRYELKSFGADTARHNVTAHAVFHGTHTGEGGPVPPTGRATSTDYVYVMQFEGDKIAHMTKVWHAGLAMKDLGWVPAPPLETGKETVRRWIEAMNEGDLDALDDLAAPGFVYHGQAVDTQGISEMKAFLKHFMAAFPDMHAHVDRTVLEGDLAALQYTVTGTQEADFLGIPAHAGRLALPFMVFARLAGGKVAEVWQVYDAEEMRRQLGADRTVGV